MIEGLAIGFELVDLENNRRRFYRLRLETDTQLPLPTMNERPGLVLIVARGRIGGKPIVRRERFATTERALERFGELAARRRRRGYAEAPVSL